MKGLNKCVSLSYSQISNFRLAWVFLFRNVLHEAWPIGACNQLSISLDGKITGDWSIITSFISIAQILLDSHSCVMLFLCYLLTLQMLYLFLEIFKTEFPGKGVDIAIIPVPWNAPDPSKVLILWPTLSLTVWILLNMHLWLNFPLVD